MAELLITTLERQLTDVRGMVSSPQNNAATAASPNNAVEATPLPIMKIEGAHFLEGYTIEPPGGMPGVDVLLILKLQNNGEDAIHEIRLCRIGDLITAAQLHDQLIEVTGYKTLKVFENKKGVQKEIYLKDNQVNIRAFGWRFLRHVLHIVGDPADDSVAEFRDREDKRDLRTSPARSQSPETPSTRNHRKSLREQLDEKGKENYKLRKQNETLREKLSAVKDAMGGLSMP